MNMRVLVLLVAVLSMAAFAQTLSDPSFPDRGGFTQIDADSGVFQVRYLANLNIGDSYVNIVNNGALHGADPNGRICANIYVFDPNEEPVSCCACPVTPNGLVSLSARNSLIANPLTPGVPTSIVVKILYSEVPSKGCDAGQLPTVSPLPNTFPTAPDINKLNLTRGGIAWATTLHANTTNSPATYQLTETRFDNSELSATEYVKIVGICNFIETYASKFGLCKGCGVGALGAGASQF